MRYLTLSLLLLLSVMSGRALAQHDLDSLLEHDPQFKESFESVRTTFSLFDSEVPLKVILTSDFKNLQKKKFKREYQEATMKVFIHDTLTATRTLKIQPRGNNRLQTCFYPPLKLNFKKGDMLIDEMKEFDKIKLVKPCKGSKGYLDFILNEYAIYKMYQVLDPAYSFRVRMMEVTYVDTSGKLKDTTVPSFLIEPVDLVAKRTESLVLETEGLNFDHLERKRADVMAVFQFMIGNTDWSIAAQHNMKVIKSTDPHRPLGIAIPYDFDYCGLVNAPYAVPPESLNLSSVRERQYRGECGDPGDIESAVELFLNKKDEVLAAFEEATPGIDKSYKYQSLKYLEEFFGIAASTSRVKRDMVESCR